eukprot:7390669-Prymnesium_polylepis.1
MTRKNRNSSDHLIKDHVRYKTELCSTFMRCGQCPYGYKCQFAHGEVERRKRNARHVPVLYCQPPPPPPPPPPPLPLPLPHHTSLSPVSFSYPLSGFTQIDSSITIEDASLNDILTFLEHELARIRC